MLKSGVGHAHDQFVGSQSIGFDDDGTVFALGRVEQWSELLQGCSLIPKVNGGRGPTGDADDLLVGLRAKGEARERQRHRNARLQNEIGAEQEKENKKENNVDQRQDNQPTEVVFLRPAKLHLRPGLAVDLNDRAVFRVRRQSSRPVVES